MTRDQCDYGHRVVTNTTSVTGIRAYGFQVLNDAVVSEITYEADYAGTANDFATITLPAGMYVPCRFTQIKLASGKVRLNLGGVAAV